MSSEQPAGLTPELQEKVWDKLATMEERQIFASHHYVERAAMTTSFPYLKIARERGVPYGDVIRAAELIGLELPGPFSWSLDLITIAQITKAVATEQERRRGHE